MKAESLIHRYLIGEATSEEVAELDSLLAKDPELRRKFVFEAGNDTALREIALERAADADSADRKVISPVFRPVAWIAAAAAVVLLAALTWTQLSQPRVVAELVTSEDAAWESSLPTAPGSNLTPGHMKLTSGIATIRFRSGAEMMLEAPAELSIKSPMLAKLDSGAAVMNVPESAIGFVLETPDGRVVDHGTSFAVNVGGQESKFEVIEGEISVHLDSTGESVRLVDQQAASITGDALSTFEGPIPEPEAESTANVLRIGTKGRSQSVMRANKKKWLHGDKLLVKRRGKPTNHERRSFFSFDLAGIDWDRVESARIRLNQVPSGIGYATRLPKISNVGVYGLTNPEKTHWEMETTWEDGPAAEDGVLLGNIELPRSKQRGSRFLGNGELLEFLKGNANGPVTFILDGAVDPDTGERVPSLVLAFASDTHPEAAGPMLELTMKE